MQIDLITAVFLVVIVLIFKLSETIFYRMFPDKKLPIDTKWAIETAVNDGIVLINNLKRNGELTGGSAVYTFRAAQHALEVLKKQGVNTETLAHLQSLVRIAWEYQRQNKAIE